MTIYVNGVKKQELNINQTINGQNPVIPGLIAHYTFDDISGATVADETGNYPGTLINGPPTVNGYLGNGTDFDPASTQYMDAGVAMGNALGNGVSALSVSLWFKADLTSGNDGLFYLGDLLTTEGEINVVIQSNLLKLRLSNSTFSRSIAFTNTSSWNHIVAMYTGSAGILYLNNSKVIDFAHSTNLNLSGLKTIIASYANTVRSFDGKIDQVRIYNKALTVPEINMLFNEKVGAWIYENGRPL